LALDIIIIIIIITTIVTGDPFDSRYFFQRVSMLIQRYNSILFREIFPAEDEIDTSPSQPGFTFLVFNPGDLLPGVIIRIRISVFVGL